MGDVIDTFMRPFVGICQAGFVDPCRHGLNAKKIREIVWIKDRVSDCGVSLGEMAHLGKKNTGIWDSQIWDPRYLVPLFLVKFPIEAFKFIR